VTGPDGPSPRFARPAYRVDLVMMSYRQGHHHEAVESLEQALLEQWSPWTVRAGGSSLRSTSTISASREPPTRVTEWPVGSGRCEALPSRCRGVRSAPGRGRHSPARRAPWPMIPARGRYVCCCPGLSGRAHGSGDRNATTTKASAHKADVNRFTAQAPEASQGPGARPGDLGPHGPEDPPLGDRWPGRHG